MKKIELVELGLQLGKIRTASEPNRHALAQAQRLIERVRNAKRYELKYGLFDSYMKSNELGEWVRLEDILK